MTGGSGGNGESRTISGDKYLLRCRSGHSFGCITKKQAGGALTTEQRKSVLRWKEMVKDNG